MLSSTPFQQKATKPPLLVTPAKSPPIAPPEDSLHHSLIEYSETSSSKKTKKSRPHRKSDSFTTSRAHKNKLTSSNLQQLDDQFDSSNEQSIRPTIKMHSLPPSHSSVNNSDDNTNNS